jgi:adenine-specific DNA-methyltransferase
MSNNIKKSRGQFFTTKNRVLDVLIGLMSNDGTIFEPSAGQGHIISAIEKKHNREIFGVELDSNKVETKICNSQIEIDNFFNYIKTCGSFDTVIGNPPFVKLKNVEKSVIESLPEKIPANGNLYYFFIKYCVSLLKHDGELIFIVPKEWLYNVSAQFVRDYLSENGGFTHFIDCGEEKLFDDADVPALCIFRYQKGFLGDLKYYENLDNFYLNKFIIKKTRYSNTITFSDDEYNGKRIHDYFDVKVGLVTGAEKVFKVPTNVELQNDYLINIVGTNGSTSRYVFVDNIKNFNDIPQDVQTYLLSKKENLVNRKIKKFNENNWWFYGAMRNFNLMNSNRKRIYGLMKTRKDKIFWKGEEFEFFGGGLIGLFLKPQIDIDINIFVKYLNSKDFKKIMKDNNMYSNNKVSITPSVLSNLPFPFIEKDFFGNL